jgi:hypothetical protein
MNMVRVKRIVLTLIVLLVFAQLVQPNRTNSPVIPSKSLEAYVRVPQQVQVILKRACGDCHSSETVWPWYSHVAPISWLITSDVNEGRNHINFQDWEAQKSPEAATKHLASICKEVRDGGMPPFSYRMIHKESRLSPEDINTVCSWSQSFGNPSESAGQGNQ